MASTSEKLRNLQDEYLKKSFKYGKDVQESEVVDILSDYAWNAEEIIANGAEININGSSTGAYQKTNIPFCYVAERKSAVNAGIANIFNVLNASGESISKIMDMFEVGKDEQGNEINSGLSNIGNDLKSLLSGGNSNEFQKLMAQNNMSGIDVFAPYEYLYVTKPTKKKFVFPLLNGASSFTEINNQWSQTDKLPPIMQLVVDTVYDTVDAMSTVANQVEAVKGLTTGKTASIVSEREIAKSFQYPEDGDSVSVNFTLYNTTRMDAWRDNYKFLYLFVLRNLPLRIDTMSYLPPMLYDVVVPGVKRLPVSAVYSINIEPKGMTRVLKCENFLNGGEVPVNVPEAWEVTITFKSLIGHSANLVLAGLYSGLSVSASSSNESLY